MTAPKYVSLLFRIRLFYLLHRFFYRVPHRKVFTLGTISLDMERRLYLTGRVELIIHKYELPSPYPLATMQMVEYLARAYGYNFISVRSPLITRPVWLQGYTTDCVGFFKRLR